MLVYERFSIQSELGEMEHSYSQPFFLSNTTMTTEEYSADTLEHFFWRSRLSGFYKAEYEGQGLVVLRATVMNPYITPIREMTGQSVVRILMEELAQAAHEHVKQI